MSILYKNFRNVRFLLFTKTSTNLTCVRNLHFTIRKKKICSDFLLKVSELAKTLCAFAICFKDPNVDNGIRCLDNAIPEDVYSLALVAYAYSVYDVRNLKRTDCLNKLNDSAITEGAKLK